MQYKTGDILKGKVNGAEFEIIKCTENHYQYKDLKTGKTFITNHKTLERCFVEKINHRSE